MGRLTHRISPGATYFVTTKGWQSTSAFQVCEIADIVVTKLLEYRNRGNYLLHEFVLMPNHLHLILTPARSTSLEKAMQLVKGGSSHEIHRLRGSKSQIWQSGFHESRVRDWSDYKGRVDYIHLNPVVARLCSTPEEWPYGSAGGKWQLDPIPQGLKPPLSEPLNVGAKAPTPTGAKAKITLPGTPGLKPPVSEVLNVGAKAPTPRGAKAQIMLPGTPGLKPAHPPVRDVGPEGPTPNTSSGAANS